MTWPEMAWKLATLQDRQPIGSSHAVGAALTPPILLLSDLSAAPGGLASPSEQREAWSPGPALAERRLPWVIHRINHSTVCNCS